MEELNKITPWEVLDQYLNKDGVESVSFCFINVDPVLFRGIHFRITLQNKNHTFLLTKLNQ